MMGGTVNRMRSVLMVLLAFMLVCMMAMSVLVKNASAISDSTRIAQITSLSGEVYVKKSGGTKEFTAYKGMTLNQGDYLRTGDDSSVVLTVLDREDEFTVDENSSLFLSSLRENDSGDKTTISVWSGSIYAKASELATGDELEIETPTAVMGVRGTHFIININPMYGDTSLFVVSGVVQAEVLNPTNDDSDTEENDKESGTEPKNAQHATVYIYPTMQGNFIPENSEEGPRTKYIVSTINPESFTEQTDSSIIQALIRHNPEAEDEREDMIGQFHDETQDGVDELIENMYKIANLLVNQAVSDGVVTREEIEELVDQANEETNEDIELGNVEEWILTPEQQALLEQLKQQEEQRRLEQQELEQQRQLEQQEMQQLLDQIKQQNQDQSEKNQEELQENEESALERFLEQLTDEEREQFLKNRQEALESTEQTNDPSSTDSTESKDEEDDETSGSSDPEPSDPEPSDPEVRLEYEQVDEQGGNLDVVLENISGIQGMQVHVLIDANITADLSDQNITVNPDHLFTSSDSTYSEPIDHYSYRTGISPDDHALYHEVLYAVINNTDGLAVDVTEPKSVLRIHVDSSMGAGEIRLAKLTIILEDGTTLELDDLNPNTITIE